MAEKTCFLIAPLGDSRSEVRRRSDVLLENIVDPAVRTFGYSLIRADRISVPGAITNQIVKLVRDADLVIADLSGMNPNVLYELGLRHAFNLPVIQMAERDERLPFDIAAARTIFYETSFQGVISARETLIQFIDSIETQQFHLDSPVAIAADAAEVFDDRLAPAPADVASSLVGILRGIDNRLAAIEQKLSREQEDRRVEASYSRRIFIVHGHDATLKNELARMLERLDFEPVILHEQPDRGQTILGKLSSEMEDVGFAFVILTPDDVGSVAIEPVEWKPRARQNVVFEHGLFAGHYTHARVCAIRRGDVEMPSDLHGLIYKTVPADSGISAIALDIVGELKAAGYIVDANKLMT